MNINAFMASLPCLWFLVKLMIPRCGAPFPFFDPLNFVPFDIALFTGSRTKGATKISQRHGAPRRNTKASIGDSGYAAVRQAPPCASGQAPAQGRAIAAPLRAYALLDTKSPRNDTKKEFSV